MACEKQAVDQSTERPERTLEGEGIDHRRAALARQELVEMTE